MTKTALIATIFLGLIISLGLADAKTVNTSDLYTTIQLYDGESLTVYNNLNGIYSLVSTNGTFPSTGGLSSGGHLEIKNIPAGTHHFFNGANPNQTGIIIMTMSPAVTVSTDKPIYTNEPYLTISGDHYPPSIPITVEIRAPDGTIFQSMSVTPNSLGTFSTPVSIAYNNPTGIYTITTQSGTKSATTTYQHGIIESTPAPVTTNSTETTPTTPIFDEIVTETPTQPGPTVPQNNVTLSATEKQQLLTYLKQQKLIIDLLIQYLNGTAS